MVIYKWLVGAGKVAQRERELATHLDDLSAVPGTYKVKGENQLSLKLCSEFPMHVVAHMLIAHKH